MILLLRLFRFYDCSIFICTEEFFFCCDAFDLCEPGLIWSLVDEFGAGDAEEEIVDLLTGALDAVEDAHDVILDVTEELEES